jgi:hypothetical protein
MMFTLAYGGEHYVLDELAGIVYALVVLTFWNRWSSRRGHDTPARSSRAARPPKRGGETPQPVR